MQSNKEERNIQTALGSIPKVNNQRAFSCTITVAGTGLGDITVTDLIGAARSQNNILNDDTYEIDQMYVHEVRAYGTAGGYLSMAPYPHRMNTAPASTGNSTLWNSYEDNFNAPSTFRRGSLCQMYEFGINGATRPELVWKWPKEEVLNNPFIFGDMATETESRETIINICKLLTLQSTNTGGSALYIVQFDITLRSSNFIEIAPALGAAAFGEKNVMSDNYKAPSNNLKKRLEEAQKAQEMANKKRKVESVKALTLPALDSA